MKLPAALVFTVCVYSISAHAAPIALKGLDLSMPKASLLEKVKSGNYKCTAPTEMMGVTTTSCKNDKSAISFYEKGGQVTRISFNCENFNICSYSLKEAAQSLINNGVIRSLKSQHNDLDGWLYRGRGESGDIEVTQDPWGRVHLDIGRGNLGSKPSFK